MGALSILGLSVLATSISGGGADASGRRFGQLPLFLLQGLIGLDADEVGHGDVILLRQLPVIRCDQLVHSQKQKEHHHTGDRQRYQVSHRSLSGISCSCRQRWRCSGHRPCGSDPWPAPPDRNGIRCRPGSPRHSPGFPPATARCWRAQHRPPPLACRPKPGHFPVPQPWCCPSSPSRPCWHWDGWSRHRTPWRTRWSRWRRSAWWTLCPAWGSDRWPPRQHRCRCDVFSWQKTPCLFWAPTGPAWPEACILHQPCFRLSSSFSTASLALWSSWFTKNRPERAATMPAMVGTVALEIPEAMARGEPVPVTARVSNTWTMPTTVPSSPISGQRAISTLIIGIPLSTAMATLETSSRRICLADQERWSLRASQVALVCFTCLG